MVDTSAVPGSSLVNTGTLLHYSGAEGGSNFATGDQHDDASVTLMDADFSKHMTGTELDLAGNNAATQAVIGEEATYQVTIDLPEGTLAGAALADAFDSGLAFVSCTSITPSSTDDISTDHAGGFAAACSAPTVTNNGRNVSFDLGNVVNSNLDDDVPETLTVTYQAVVLNTLANQAGTNLHNNATLSWTGHSVNHAAPEAVTIVEPALTVDKSVNSAAGGFDAGDPVTYTIVIRNSSALDAFETTLEDTIPAGISSLTLSGVVDTASLVSSGNFNLTGHDITTVTPFDMAADPARSITVSVTGVLAYSVNPGQLVSNTALVRWSSMAGTVSDRSSYNGASDERTGADGVGPDTSTLNNYAASDNADLNVNSTQNTKYIHATSEGFTGNDGVEHVAIGEIVRYRLVISLPEGCSPNFQVRDQLPAGLTFLDDGNARMAFVSDDPIVSTSAGNVAAFGSCEAVDTTDTATDSLPASLPCGFDTTNIGSDSNTLVNFDPKWNRIDCMVQTG